MKKIAMSFLLIIISINIFVSCTTIKPSKEIPSESTNDKIVSFVEFLKFKVIDEVKLEEKYLFKKELLDNDEYKTIWDLQRALADDYVDKNIEVYKTTINNDKINYKNNNKSAETELYIMLSDGNIFGGYSIAEIKGEKKHFTLDGLDLDEFKTNKLLNPIIEVKNTDKDVITTDVFTGYLNANKKDWYFVQVSSLDREPVETWTDFSINRIKISNNNENFFTADIGYNIKITAESNYFAAGNGVAGDDYWINNKSNFFDLLKVGENKYVILTGYTG